MTTEKLMQLTKEQEALIPVTRQKWIDAVHLPLDIEKAKKGLEFIYSLINKPPPLVVVLQNPYEVQIAANLLNQTTKQCYSFSESVLFDSFWVGFYEYFLLPELGLNISPDLREKMDNFSEYLSSGVSTSVLFEKIALICGPPSVVRRDDQGRSSAIGQPAIEWPRGWERWKIGNVGLDNKRYHCHPSEWKAEWLIDEPNTEIKRLILEYLTPDVVFDELGAVLIDSWREYELYNVTRADIGVRLLRMKSPPLKDDSTPYYVGTVPESIETAEEAIVWRNRGHHPDEFAWVA